MWIKLQFVGFNEVNEETITKLWVILGSKEVKMQHIFLLLYIMLLLYNLGCLIAMLV